MKCLHCLKSKGLFALSNSNNFSDFPSSRRMYAYTILEHKTTESYLIFDKRLSI